MRGSSWGSRTCAIVDFRVPCSPCGRGGRRVLAPKTRFSDLLGECDALRTGWTGLPVTACDGGCARCTGLVPIVGLGERGGVASARVETAVSKFGGTCPNLGVMAFGEGRDRPRSHRDRTEIDRSYLKRVCARSGKVPGNFWQISHSGITKDSKLTVIARLYP